MPEVDAESWINFEPAVLRAEFAIIRANVVCSIRTRNQVQDRYTSLMWGWLLDLNDTTPTTISLLQGNISPG